MTNYKSFDWQRKRREEKAQLKQMTKVGHCERCGTAFDYVPIIGLDKPRHCSLLCKRISEGKASDGSR